MTNTRVIARDKAPDLLIFFHETLASILKKNGITQNQAAQIADNAIDTMRFQFGGQCVYFPMGVSIDHKQKALQIMNDFNNGTTVAELAYRHGCSIQNIYQIIKGERVERKTKRNAKQPAELTRTVEA